MKYNTLTERQTLALKKNKLNDTHPFKLVVGGIMNPFRFETEKEAREMFDKIEGRCLLSYNTNIKCVILAYKFE